LKVLICILDTTDIRDITKALLVLGQCLESPSIATKHQLIPVLLELKKKRMNQHLNPTIVLSKLVKNPVQLLHVMRDTDVVLYGFRALEYFAPGSSHTDDPWTFAGPSDPAKLEHFARLSGLMGLHWSQERRTVAENSYQALGFSSRNKSYVLRLSWSDKVSSLENVLHLPISAAQCCITGIGAFSTYHVLTAIREFIILPGNGSSGESALTHTECLQTRGFKLVSYPTYDQRLRKMYTGLRPTDRTLNDPGSCGIQFLLSSRNAQPMPASIFRLRCGWIRWNDRENKTSQAEAVSQADFVNGVEPLDEDAPFNLRNEPLYQQEIANLQEGNKLRRQRMASRNGNVVSVDGYNLS